MDKNTIKNVLIILIVVGLGIFLLRSRVNTTPTPTTPTKPTEVKRNEITITSKKLKETNFAGSMSVVSGSSKLALESISFINKTIDEFKKQADVDVPDMRDKFGADAPMANYTIDIEATHKTNKKVESIVISVYAYTGGANGNSSYKVINALPDGGRLLSLSDIVVKGKESALLSVVKKSLKSWVPKGSDAPVVFPEAVDELTFDNLSNWSLDDMNLYIYFDKYAIGPGVLGAVVYPVPLSQIKGLLSTNF